MATFVIESEEDAWKLLAQFVNGEVELDDAPQFEFKGWPEIEVYLPGTPIKGSISPTMMTAFIELQKAIHRSYQLVSSNSADLRALTTHEREQLEIRVKVGEGSSEYDIDLGQIIQRIGLEAVAKMDGNTIALTILGVAVIIGGVTAFRAWLGHKAEQRKAELNTDEQRAVLNFQTALVDSTATNMRILAAAMQKQPLLDDVEGVTEPARTQLIKSLGEEGGGRAFGVNLDAREAQEIASQKRQQSETVRLAGNYRVIKVDTSVADGFRVTLGDDTNDREIVASMQDALISEEHKTAIREAEWKKRPVYVELTARKLRHRIVDAVVLSASPAKEQTG